MEKLRTITKTAAFQKLLALAWHVCHGRRKDWLSSNGKTHVLFSTLTHGGRIISCAQRCVITGRYNKLFEIQRESVNGKPISRARGWNSFRWGSRDARRRRERREGRLPRNQMRERNRTKEKREETRKRSRETRAKRGPAREVAALARSRR